MDWDNYKHTIEALSGGRNTVEFDDLDLPSVMVRIRMATITI